MNKVYILTAGKYSEYHVVGATLDRKQAELACKVYGLKSSVLEDPVDPDDYDPLDDPIRIEEYDLDLFDGIKEKYHIYRVSFSDGSCSVEEENEEGYLHPINEEDMIWGTYRVTVAAQDEAHALKIAQDKRAEYLARKEGIT